MKSSGFSKGKKKPQQNIHKLQLIGQLRNFNHVAFIHHHKGFELKQNVTEIKVFMFN